MHRVLEARYFPFSRAQMFALVNDVASYPEFIEHCVSSKVLEESSTYMQASISLSLLSSRIDFETRNILSSPASIDMSLVKGPFKSLSGQWRFLEKGDGTLVEFESNFQFNSMLRFLPVASLFSIFLKDLIGQFERRAVDLYDV